MECQIGEIRKVGNKWLQCIEGTCNKECYFYNRSIHKTIAGINGNDFGACNACFRSDNKSVIFKELEKIGGSYDDCGTILQRFKIYTNVTNADTKGLELHIYSNDTIGIEIKENKEDMKEGKIQHYDCFFDKEQSKPNLKPFSLELAKQDKPVCTKNGKKVRIICFDAKGILPIIALVESGDEEKTVRYSNSGRFRFDGMPDEEDLMMLIEKKEGWINVYENRCYNTKEEAVENRDPYAYCMTTVKVSWEE